MPEDVDVDVLKKRRILHGTVGRCRRDIVIESTSTMHRALRPCFNITTNHEGGELPMGSGMGKMIERVRDSGFRAERATTDMSCRSKRVTVAHHQAVGRDKGGRPTMRGEERTLKGQDLADSRAGDHARRNLLAALKRTTNSRMDRQGVVVGRDTGREQQRALQTISRHWPAWRPSITRTVLMTRKSDIEDRVTTAHDAWTGLGQRTTLLGPTAKRRFLASQA